MLRAVYLQPTTGHPLLTIAYMLRSTSRPRAIFSLLAISYFLLTTCRAASRLFHAVAATGAWGCLDEIQHVSGSVLSVVAQHLSSLSRAKAEMRSIMEYVVRGK